MLAALPSPPSNGLHIGPLFVHAYGLAYVLAITAAVIIARRRWTAHGGDPGLVDEVALWGVPAGLIGGRLYFLATSWSEVPDHWWGPFAIWHGGLGIWGGIAGGTVAGLWVLRRRGADIPAFLDAAAPALLVAQAIGRVGNYFNQELFGGPTSLPWALEIDPEHRPAGYAQDAAFHPTFLYEIVWNLALAGLLVHLGARHRVRPPGLFALYVAGYSLGRIGEELLRVDPSHHIFGLRLNFFVASLLCVIGIAWFLRSQGRSVGGSTLRGAALVAAGSLICLSACGRTAAAAAAPPACVEGCMLKPLPRQFSARAALLDFRFRVIAPLPGGSHSECRFPMEGGISAEAPTTLAVDDLRERRRGGKCSRNRDERGRG
jgi:prolipoprotein diacylglyceryl transferase